MKRLLIPFFILLLLPLALCASDEVPTRVILHTTAGDIVLSLYEDTPQHRDHFIRLAEEGYFDGKAFDRVISDFMIQCGPEQTTHNLPAEIHYPKHYHKRGALAMGRSGDDPQHLLQSNAQQFYIVWGKVGTDASLQRADSLMRSWSYGQARLTRRLRRYYSKHPGTPHLDGSYTVFGEVVQGLEIVEQIQGSKTDTNDRPLQPVTIRSAQVQRPFDFLQNRRCRISIDTMLPRRLPSRSVSPGYEVNLLGDSIEVYLPYIGEVYQPEFTNEGLNFRLPLTGFGQAKNKRGSFNIVATCRRSFVTYLFRIELFTNGRAYVYLQPSNATAIGYEGRWEE